MRRYLPLLGLIAACFCPAISAAPEQVLFGFDDRAFPFQYGVRTQLIGYHAKLAADTQTNIVLRPGPAGAPDSLGTYYYGSVQQVGDELYMWYLGCGDHDPAPVVSHLKVCFARSRDGKHWEKPALNLVEYAGSTANNLVSLDGRAFDDLVETVTLYDPSDPNSDRRFKMAFESKGRYKGRLAVAFSPDGLRWKQSAANPCGPQCEMSGVMKHDGAYYVCAHAGGAWNAIGEWTRGLGGLEPFMRSSAKPTATTPVLTSDNPSEVFLNVSDLTDVSGIKVSILDEQFRPLPGFGTADCSGPTRSGLRQKATWTKGSRIPAGKPFRIRIDFGGIRPEDVKLYAAYVAPAS